MNAWIEIHHFSNGLIYEPIGTRQRPQWVPDPQLVGLHNDISPAEGEFVIEFSRHKKGEDKVIWLAVYTYGIDAVHGNRDNYIGIGIWLLNMYPNNDVLLSLLVQYCQLLTREPIDVVKSHCSNIFLKQNRISSWIKPINTFPNQEMLSFDTNSYTRPIYIKTKENSLEGFVNEISNYIFLSILGYHRIPAIHTRFLYVILKNNIINESQTFESLLAIIDDNEKFDIKKAIAESFENYNIGLLSKNKNLEDTNQKISDLAKEKIESLENKVKELTENHLQLSSRFEVQTKQVTQFKNERDELSKRINKRTFADIVQDLRAKSIHNEEFLSLINELDRTVIVTRSSEKSTLDYERQLNDIKNSIDKSANSISILPAKIQNILDKSSKTLLLKEQLYSDYGKNSKSDKNIYLPYLNIPLIILVIVIIILISSIPSSKDIENIIKNAISATVLKTESTASECRGVAANQTNTNTNLGVGNVARPANRDATEDQKCQYTLNHDNKDFKNVAESLKNVDEETLIRLNPKIHPTDPIKTGTIINLPKDHPRCK